MTDQPDQPDQADQPDQPPAGADDPLDPARDAQVRRLLGEARVDPATEGLPPEVAARLEATLGELVADRETTPDTSPTTSPDTSPDTGTHDAARPAPAGVTDLAHRRRRRAGALLLAAAAVVVGGVSLTQVIDGGDDAGAGSVASESVDSGDGAQRREEGEGGAEAAPEAATGSDAPTEDEDLDPPLAAPSTTTDEGPAVQPPTTAGATVAGVRVRSSRFADDVRLLQRVLPRLQVATARLPRAAVPAPLRARRVVECRSTVVGEGASLLVLYDTTPGLLVFRPATEDAQVVDLLQCGTGRTLRSTTLALRPGG